MEDEKKYSHACKYFPQGTCKKGDKCPFVHTTNLCGECQENYTTRDMCSECYQASCVPCEECGHWSLRKLCMRCFKASQQPCQTCGKLSLMSFCRECWPEEQQRRREERQRKNEDIQRQYEEAELAESVWPCATRDCPRKSSRQYGNCKECHHILMQYTAHPCTRCRMPVTGGARLCLRCRGWDTP